MSESVRDEYDVVLVGAGPAGATVARIAADECDVLLFRINDRKLESK